MTCCVACDGDGSILDLQHSDACYEFAECVGGVNCPHPTEIECPVCGGSGVDDDG